MSAADDLSRTRSDSHLALKRRPRCLDLFCGAGGAAMGLYRAGFDLTGIDNRPQKNYPFRFIQGDALNPPVDLRKFDMIWASPPCQSYSRLNHAKLNGKNGVLPTAPKLIPVIRSVLKTSQRPFVIENVVGAPLISPIMLCGWMFGHEIYRHRLFESNFDLWRFQPEHPKHETPAVRVGSWKPGCGKFHSFGQHTAHVAESRRVMQIDWTNRDELSEAIPPYFTEYIGKHMLILMRQKGLL